MKKRLGWFLVSVVFLFIFWEFSKIVARSTFLRSWDFDMTVKLRNFLPEKLDPLFDVGIFLASFQVSSLILVVILFFTKKKRSVACLFIFFLGLGLVWWGKEYIPHSPPAFMFHRQNQDMIFSPYFAADENSYPSGHTYRIVFVFIFSAFYFLKRNKKVVVVGLFTTILTLIGLVVLGHHWSSDIVGGVILAMALASLARMLY